VDREGRDDDGRLDDGLMARIADGDQEAMRELVARWERPVHGFLYHMVGATEDAEDLAQETFLRVFTEAPRYQPERRFRAWFFRIAGNLARSQLRRRKIVRWVRFEPLWHDRAGAERGADDELAVAEQREAVRRAIAELPWRQRQAVVLKRFEDLSYREIAVALDATVPGVESLLQRATAALRRKLAREGGRS